MRQHTMDQKFIDLYDEYTHVPLDRRTFLERLAILAGSAGAALALLPALANRAAAAQIEASDARLQAETVTFKGATGEVRSYLARPKEAGKKKLPGVIVIHENRGLTPHIQDVTR